MTDSAEKVHELRGLDAAKVGAWMEANVHGCRGPVTFEVIAAGHSNLTFGASDAAGRRYVVRRGPLRRAGGGAHDVAREHRVIAALGPTSVPVPEALGLCEDETVNGAPFLVMSRVAGAVIAEPSDSATHLDSRAARTRAGQQIVDVLAAIHTVDIETVRLSSANSNGGDFIARQIRRFRSIWTGYETDRLPEIIELADRLQVAMPAQRHTGIVHGDYRMGNVMMDPSGTLVAVLDWELWTLGDVLADVGFLLNSWYEPNDPEPKVFMEDPPTVDPSFGSRVDVLARYEAATGFDVSAIDFYRAFQHWRMAVLAEGVKRRYETNQMRSADVDHTHLEERVGHLATLADHYLRRVTR